jgi:hypothetical protein
MEGLEAEMYTQLEKRRRERLGRDIMAVFSVICWRKQECTGKQI